MKPKKRPIFAAASPLLVALSVSSIQAASLYWDVSATNNLTAGNGTWGTDSFWATSTTPLLVAPGPWTDGSDAFFQTGGTNVVGIAAGGVSVTSVTQTTSGTVTTLSSGGGTLSLTGSGSIVNSGNQTFTINAPINLVDAGTYTFQTSSTITVGGAISGSGATGISKSGTSVLNLNSANSYSGGTSINAGRISVGASGNLGTNVSGNFIAISAGANLALAAASNVGSSQIVEISSSASGLGGLGVAYSGALPALDTTGTGSDGGVFGLNLTGTAGISSLATLDSTLNASGGTGHWYLGAQTTGTFDGTVLAPASDNIYRLGGGGGTLTFNQANVITGANDLRIGASVTNGGGTVVLGAAQNHTGSTTVSGGTLKLGNAGALGDLTTHTTGLTVNGSGIFDFGGISPTYATLPITLNSTANGFDVGAFSNSGAAVSFGGTVEMQRQTRIGGTGGITLTGTITGGGFNLIKDSTSTLNLSNNGTVALGALQSNRGTIQVNAGTTLNVTSIDIGTGNNVGAGLTLSGGAINSSGTSRFAQGIGSASATLNLNSGTLTVPALTKGTLTFTANFDGGTLKARAASSAFVTATTANVKNGGAVIDSDSYDITIAQSLLRFAGATTDKLTKNGNGFLALAGTNTYGGGTDINSGGVTFLNTNAKPALGTINVAANATIGLGVGTGLFSSVDVDALFAGTLAGVTNSATSNVGIDTTAGSFVYSSSVPSNTRGLVKLGANTLTLNGTNAYTGVTTVRNGALTLTGNQTGATGGFLTDITNGSAATLNLGSGSQTANTSVLVASGKVIQLGAIGGGSLGTGFQAANVAGAASFPTSVTNNGSLGVGRNSTLSINANSVWTQNGSMNIEGYGGYNGQVNVNTGGSFTYAGSSPIHLTASSGMSGFTRLHVNGGTFTTGQAIHFNGNSGNTGVASFVLYGNGTLKLSDNIADLITGDSSGLVYFANGGSVIDTNGFSTTLSRSVANFPSNIGSLTKQGSGTLTLSGTNSYTGTTTVAGGTLEVTGSLGATTVTIQNEATLSGHGDIGGDVTIQSGGHQALSVASSAGSQVARTIAGVLDLAAGNILDLTAASTPAPGGPYVLVTASGGITGSPGTVNLSGLTGTVAVNGNNLELTVTAPVGGFSSWIDTPSFGLTAGQKGATADPDNDGINNLLEYALNGDPSVSSPSILPSLTVTSTAFEYTYSRLDLSLADTSQIFQFGSDLTGWSLVPIPSAHGTTTVGVTTVTVTDTGATDSVKVSVPKTSSVGGKLFGRLNVTQP